MKISTKLLSDIVSTSISFTLIAIMAFSFTNINVANAQSGDTDTSGSNGNSCVTLDNNLRYRMRDSSVNNEVSDLQDYLIAEGYLSGNTTGFFGVATLKAVKSFQSANGLLSSGYVGPVTRAKIKALSCLTVDYYQSKDPIPVTPSNPISPVNPPMPTKPVACTMEYRSCPDGSTMYRDANCGWHAEMCKGVSDIVKKINVSSATFLDKGQSENKVELTINGSGFNSTSPLVHVNSGCSIGGTLLSTQTDTKITVTFVRDYFYTQCTTPGTSANVYISGNGVSDSNAYPLSVPYVKINTNPTLSSAYFDQNGNLTFTGSGFNTNGGYYVDYKFDCTNANGSGCSGKLDKTRITYIDNNKISFGLDLSILNGAAGNVSFRLNDKNDNAISQLYTLPYNVQPTSISAQSGVPGVTLNNSMIDYNAMKDISYNNSHMLNYVDIVRGQYQSIEVKYSCGAYLNADMTLKDNYALNGNFMSYEGTRAFSCPSSTRLMKGGADTMTVANITRDNDKLTYIVNYYEGWRDTATNRKDEPLGNLDFYGVSSDGSKVYLKTVTFIHSIKG